MKSKYPFAVKITSETGEFIWNALVAVDPPAEAQMPGTILLHIKKPRPPIKDQDEDSEPDEIHEMHAFNTFAEAQSASKTE